MYQSYVSWENKLFHEMVQTKLLSSIQIIKYYI